MNSLICSRCGQPIIASYEPGRCYAEDCEPSEMNHHDEGDPMTDEEKAKLVNPDGSKSPLTVTTTVEDHTEMLEELNYLRWFHKEAVPHLDSVHPGIVPEINQMYVMVTKREVPLRYRVNKT